MAGCVCPYWVGRTGFVSRHRTVWVSRSDWRSGVLAAAIHVVLVVGALAWMLLRPPEEVR